MKKTFQDSNSSGDDNPMNMFKAAQQQYNEEVHDMLDDLSMPNQSMTISNLSCISASPFRGGATPTRNMFGNTASASQLNFGGTNTASQSSLVQKSGRDAFLDNLDTINTIPQQTQMAPTILKSNQKVFGTLGVHSSSDEEDMPVFNKKGQGNLDIKDLSTEQEDMKAYMKEENKSGRNSPEFVSYGNEKQSELTDRSGVPFKMKVDFDNTPGGRTGNDRSVASGQHNLTSDMLSKGNRTFPNSVKGMNNTNQQSSEKSSDSGMHLKFTKGHATLAQHAAAAKQEEPDNDDAISAMSYS